MPEIYIDGERVEFDGGAPQTLGDLHALLEQVAGTRGRVLVAVEVDGAALSETQSGLPLGQAHRVVARTISLTEAIAQLAESCARELGVVRGEVERVACEVLREPWEKAQGNCVQLAESLGRVLESASLLAAHARGDDIRIQQETAGLGSAIGAWMDAINARDAAGVCLRLDRDVIPALVKLGAEVGRLSGTHR